MLARAPVHYTAEDIMTFLGDITPKARIEEVMSPGNRKRYVINSIYGASTHHAPTVLYGDTPLAAAVGYLQYCYTTIHGAWRAKNTFLRRPFNRPEIAKAERLLELIATWSTERGIPISLDPVSR